MCVKSPQRRSQNLGDDFGDVRKFARNLNTLWANSHVSISEMCEILPRCDMAILETLLLRCTSLLLCPEDNRRARDAEHGASADLRDDTRDDRRDVDGRRCRPSRGSRGR